MTFKEYSNGLLIGEFNRPISKFKYKHYKHLDVLTAYASYLYTEWRVSKELVEIAKQRIIKNNLIFYDKTNTILAFNSESGIQRRYPFAVLPDNKHYDIFESVSNTDLVVENLCKYHTKIVEETVQDFANLIDKAALNMSVTNAPNSIFNKEFLDEL